MNLEPEEIFDPEADLRLKWLSKANCRHCHGRGKLTFVEAGTGRRRDAACSCVLKRMARGY